VADLAFLAVVVAFFLAAVAYVRACGWLARDGSDVTDVTLDGPSEEAR
jgi:hypothetical protein